MMQGFNLNSLHTADIEAVSCEICGAPAGEYCRDLQTPLSLRRIDYHMDRKWRAAQEKENLKSVQEAQNAAQVGEIEENNLGEHTSGSEGGETAEAGGGDSTPQVEGEEVNEQSG